MKTFKYLPVVILLVFISKHAFATAEDDFEKGVVFFKQQNYQDASKFFNLAYKKGLATPALLHNLGVTYFKLEQYPQAKNYFELARNFPDYNMLAEYNLGLVAKKQNNMSQANKHFSLVRKQGGDSKLAKLARIQLGEKPPEDLQKSWSAYLSLEYGHDDNITVVSDTAITRKQSNYAYVFANADYQILGDAKTGLTIEGDISSFDYTAYNQYDSSKYQLAIIADLQLGSFANSLGVSKIHETYADQDYQTIRRFTASTHTYISAYNRLRFRYTHDDISIDNPLYAYLDGTRQRFRTELRNKQANHYFKIYHELETNDRRDTTAASFSPTRNKFRIYYEYALTPSFNVGANYIYRISTYPRKAGALYREDTRQVGELRLSYQLSDSWKVRASIEQTDNESTNPSYTYQKEITSISFIALF